MTNFSVIENKISAAKKYLKILQRYRKYSKEELVGDIDLCGATERYLYLAVQATIDLSEAVIAFKKFRKPVTFSEAFSILEEEGIINQKMAQILINMTGFRNIIIHDYEKINYDIVYNILNKKLKDIESFLELVEEKVIR